MTEHEKHSPVVSGRNEAPAGGDVLADTQARPGRVCQVDGPLVGRRHPGINFKSHY